MKTAWIAVLALILCLVTTALFAQRGFRMGAGIAEQPLRGEPAEWTFARLAYDGADGGRSSWTVDYPMAEYHFSRAIARMTRLNAHSSGHVVSVDSDEMFDYPWLYVVEPGTWGLSASQAERLREYLLRGGFLMADDFHGEYEWQVFMAGMRRIFPGRPVEDLPEDDPIYLTPFDLDERVQVPGPMYMYTGLTYERTDGVTPHWRGIRDDEGRIMVAISHNMDLGEGWEQADTPAYPESFTRQAYEIGINYVIYSMTH